MKDINIEEIFGKAKEMQGQFQKMQESFTHKEITAIAGIEDTDGIFVKVNIDGMRKVKDLIIGEGVLAQGSKILVELIIGAMNQATDKLNEEMQKEVKKIYTVTGSIPKEIEE